MALSAIGSVYCAGDNPAITADSIKEMRRKAAHKQRRIIQNNDGCDVTFKCRKPTPEGLLSVWTAGLEGSQVDAIFYCSHWGVGTVLHRSKVATPMIARGGHFENNKLKDLIDQGTDPLEIVGNFCHANNMELFCSFRMNDIHSGDFKEYGEPYYAGVHAPWKYEHPEYLLGTEEMGRRGERMPHFGQSRAWGAVNYGIPEVRDYMFRIIEEVCQDYDVDGIEMDFFRHPLFFRSHVWEGKAGQKDRDIMTGFIRRVRKMMDEVSIEKGKVLLLSIRTPDSVGYCRDIGLSIERWMQEGLVDMFVPSGYFQLEPWESSVALGHKYNVTVYPCLTDARGIYEGEYCLLDRNSANSFRARALRAWNSDADGIYLFNVVYFFKPQHQIYRELGDPNVLARGDKYCYVSVLRTDIVDGYLTDGEKDYLKVPALHPQRPLQLSRTETKTVCLIVDDDVMWGKAQGISAKIKLRLKVDRPTTGKEFSVKLNGVRLDKWDFDSKGFLEYPVEPKLVKEGINEFAFLAQTSSEGDLKVRDLQLWISYK